LNSPDANWKTRHWLSHHVHGRDLHGIGRIGISAVGSVVDVVEELQMKLIGGWLARGPVGRISCYTYARIRWVTALTGRWLDVLLASPGPPHVDLRSSAERETVLSTLNGFFGDRLASAGNPLAIPMRLRQHRHALTLNKQALAQVLANPTGKILVLVHGLCRADFQWRRNHHDHGEALARDLGYTPVYLHYNTGRHVSTNGREFAQLLDELVRAWPVEVEELAIIGHSMGGLVARSACHYGKQARHEWLRHLRHLVFLGTPHHGVPLERGGNWLVEMIGRNALVAPIAHLARLRSAGITDLRYSNLVDEDWHGLDRFEHAIDKRLRVPLPKGVKCHTIAGTTGRREGDVRDRLLGDGVIPLDTALGRHPDEARTLHFPKSHQWIAFGVHHLDLLNRPEVYQKLKSWLGAAPRKPATPGETDDKKAAAAARRQRLSRKGDSLRR
jgi:pimeloyl-ACP methyl ester carboxylesterase